jgi:hypothetical protein
MAASGASARLQATYKGNKEAFVATREEVEKNSASWEHFGMTTAQVGGILAQARGRGISVETLLGNPQAIADTALALGDSIPQAFDKIARGGRGVHEGLAKLNLPQWQQRQFEFRYRNAPADVRLRMLFDLVEHSRFAGQASAQAGAA